MRMFMASCLATIVLAFGAAMVLSQMQKSSENRYTSPAGVRL